MQGGPERTIVPPRSIVATRTTAVPTCPCDTSSPLSDPRARLIHQPIAERGRKRPKGAGRNERGHPQNRKGPPTGPTGATHKMANDHRVFNLAAATRGPECRRNAVTARANRLICGWPQIGREPTGREDRAWEPTGRRTVLREPTGREDRATGRNGRETCAREPTGREDCATGADGGRPVHGS